MQRRLITVMLFAVLAALAASTVLYRAMAASSVRPAHSVIPEVLVATHDLAAGSLITESDVRSAQWPGVVSSQWVSRRAGIVGRGLTSAVNGGEPFPENRLAAPGSGAAFASRIPQGMRMLAVHVDDQSGLSRLIGPGMHVDVISTTPVGGPNSGSRTILQNVSVLSTDQSGERTLRDKLAPAQSVNLLVSPEQAEAVSLAIVQNRIQLVLRNPLDNGSITEGPAKEARPRAAMRHLPDAASAESKAETKNAPPLQATIEIMHGNKKTIATVPAGAGQENIQ